MHVETFEEVKSIATEKWHEYKEASKKSNNPVYKDLQKVYNQIKGGKKVVDIFKVIQKGGIHEDTHFPKLAIAKAKTKTVVCKYFKNGTVCFLNNEGWREKVRVCDVNLQLCLPTLPDHLAKNNWESIRLKAPVPLIPPQHLPNSLTDDYYILWEVDEWKMTPPTDPYLLKRITNNLFVVLAAWDLTPLEKAVMAGRMH